MNAKDAIRMLKDVAYKDWAFFISGKPDFYLQVRFPNPDGTGRLLTGRKWRLSEHMSRTELIQTALMAVLAAEEHEAREAFQYKGQAVFGPHIDVDARLVAADQQDARPEIPRVLAPGREGAHV